MLIPTFGRHLLKFWVEIKKLEKPRRAKWNSFCWLLQWTSMNGRQIFSIHIVLKCQRSSEAQTFARLQHFYTFAIEIKDRMQYCMEESKRGCRARALSIGTRLLYALRAALRAAGGRYNGCTADVTEWIRICPTLDNWCDYLSIWGLKLFRFSERSSRHTTQIQRTL